MSVISSPAWGAQKGKFFARRHVDGQSRVLRFSNEELLQELERLRTVPPSDSLIDRVLRLLRYLDYVSLTNADRSRILVPDEHGKLHQVSNVYFNDFTDRLRPSDIPQDMILANSLIERDLALNLGMQNLISL